MYKTKIQLIIISFFLMVLTTSFRQYHALYVSVIEIDTSVPEKVDVTIKVFSDDLQNVIRNYAENYIPQPIESFIEPNRKSIQNYFNTNLKIVINGKSLDLEFTSFEKENDAHFLYFSGSSDTLWNSIEVTAPFFIELFPDQSNIISVSYKDDKYHGRITATSQYFTQKFYP